MNDVVNWNSASYINWTTDTGIPLRVETAWDWLVFCDVWVNRCYSLIITPNILGNTATATIVDIGANVGYFSLYAAHECRKSNVPCVIYAFEALPETFEKLVLRVANLPINCYRGAVGKKVGNTRITVSDNHGTSFTTENEDTDYPHYVVPYIDLNTVLPARVIDVLKCDIEGSEYDLVYNYPEIFKRTRIVYMEIHYRNAETLESLNGAEKDLREKMKEYGFSGHRILVNHETASVEVFYRV